MCAETPDESLTPSALTSVDVLLRICLAIVKNPLTFTNTGLYQSTIPSAPKDSLKTWSFPSGGVIYADSVKFHCHIPKGHAPLSYHS